MKHSSAPVAFTALAVPALLVAAFSSTSIKIDCKHNLAANKWSRRKNPNICFVFCSFQVLTRVTPGMPASLHQCPGTRPNTHRAALIRPLSKAAVDRHPPAARRPVQLLNCSTSSLLCMQLRRSGAHSLHADSSVQLFNRSTVRNPPGPVPPTGVTPHPHPPTSRCITVQPCKRSYINQRVTECNRQNLLHSCPFFGAKKAHWIPFRPDFGRKTANFTPSCSLRLNHHWQRLEARS